MCITNPDPPTPSNASEPATEEEARLVDLNEEPAEHPVFGRFYVHEETIIWDEVWDLSGPRRNPPYEAFILKSRAALNARRHLGLPETYNDYAASSELVQWATLLFNKRWRKIESDYFREHGKVMR